ncbi:MAG: 3-dehydroquinate synthase [Thermoleophilia bacterium]|nr:3-dehydroquinate synthase [Thermoleophilia bacterium]
MSTVHRDPVIVAAIGTREVPVYLGVGMLDAVGGIVCARGETSGVFVVVDDGVIAAGERVAESCRSADLRVTVAAVAAGEASKSLGEIERLAREAAQVGIRRRDVVVAVGGGVVGDLAGFLAATYQRGVRLVQVPTTLLAMVDSSLGGKTGVDLPEGKNYVGAVWQPEAVVMDTGVLRTLSARELSCGFAEVVKYGLLVGGDLMGTVAAWPSLPGPDADLTDLIRRCADVKLEVVADDEFDLGRRAILNLGHTVGHAIEAAAGYDLYHHGEAISLGLLAALRISERVLGLDPVWRERTAEILARHGLPIHLDPSVGVAEVIEIMSRDKKADGRALNMVLLRAPGDVLSHQNPDPAIIRAAVEDLSS